MRIGGEVRAQLATRFEVLLPHLNERQQRLALATEARLLGHGGVRAVTEAAGVSATTVRRGVAELEAGEDPLPVRRARRPGGGRKPATAVDPDLVSALLALVEPDERGDPMSPLRWTTKSLRHLAEELSRQGHPVSAPTVGRLPRENGFSLQGTTKTLEGKQHPDRDAQFRYINEQVKAHQDAGEPVVSVDAKKKEQLGQLPAAGREWRPKSDPVRVDDHSFFTAGRDTEQAIPYGVYDLTADSGWVNVGVDHDTATIAYTRTRTGLAVAAELDTGRYPLGISVTREALRALPIEAHEQRGEWNYTVAPAGDVVPVRAEHRARATTVALAMLAEERLTGMEAGELAELTGLLAPAQAAQAAQRCHEQRGGPRRRAPGAGSQGLLSDADRVLVTIVYLRQLCSQNILSDLLGVNANSIGQAIAETRLLLTEHGRVITRPRCASPTRKP